MIGDGLLLSASAGIRFAGVVLGRLRAAVTDGVSVAYNGRVAAASELREGERTAPSPFVNDPKADAAGIDKGI